MKKRTRHAAARAIKKMEAERMRFFDSKIKVRLHPFKERSFERVVDEVLRIPPEKIPLDAFEYRSIFLEGWAMGFESMRLISAISDNASDLHFSVFYELPKVCRLFNWETFFEYMELNAHAIGLDPSWVFDYKNGVGMDAQRERLIDFSVLPFSVLNLVRLASAHLREKDRVNAKGRIEFVRFIAQLLEIIIFKAKGVAFGYYGKERYVLKYEYSLDQEERARLRSECPYLTASGRCNGPWYFLPPASLSTSILTLFRILDDRKWCKRVVLVSTNDSTEELGRTLSNFCWTRGVSFTLRHYPYEPLDFDFDSSALILIPQELHEKLLEYTEFGSFIVLPIKEKIGLRKP